MELKNLGNSGLKVSAVGLGCMNMGMMNDEAQSQAVVEKALDLGVTLFDTADIYGNRGQSEEWLGKALGKRRPDVVVATKFASAMGDGDYMKGGSRRYIMKAVDASLSRLSTDYIDLYQMHFPDASTPIEETLRALDDLISAGKVRYIGCSNFAGWQIVEAQWTAHEANVSSFVSAQNRYSLMTRDIDKEVVPAVQAYGLGILPYFPLESGLLTGKIQRDKEPPEGSRLSKWRGAFRSDSKFDKIDKLNVLGKENGHSLLDYAIGWLVSRPYVSSVIAGVTSPEQLEANVTAGEAKLNDDELKAIEEITGPPLARGGPG